jgi:predicted metalloprotease with PDZ domain
MTKIQFSAINPSLQFIHISVVFETNEDKTIIQLPSWRPGRYELGNFAKNIKNFKVLNDEKQQVAFKKITKDSWEVDTENISTITVSYQYYANLLNAGSTFLDENQLYVNPVNACVYSQEQFQNPVEVVLDIPDYWDVATSMNLNNGVYSVNDFDELFDSPFIASSQLQHRSYESHGTTFNVWFNGEVKPQWTRLLKDFKAFTDKQIATFGEFPVKEYHFLNQILPVKVYHGVEHLKSTVIALGPSYEVFNTLYPELLGVSSHELYHTWNVKAIRPIDMFPYDFTKENYSELGYICEGVTTYLGDLFLLKSKVFSDQEYFKELNTQLQRHFDNSARFSYSVAESSFDTWLDGYEPGAPGRKVSIYTEGCLLAFVTDVLIMKGSANKSTLDAVMRQLYFDYALEGKGVSEEDYKKSIENFAGVSMDELFQDFIHGTKPFESIIVSALDYLGLELDHEPSPIYSEAKLGFRTVVDNGKVIVKAMYPGSPAEVGNVMLEDEIIALNGMLINNNLDSWLNYFDEDTKTITVQRGGVIKEITLPEVNRNFYMKYSVRKMQKPTRDQQNAFDAWKK